MVFRNWKEAGIRRKIIFSYSMLGYIYSRVCLGCWCWIWRLCVSSVFFFLVVKLLWRSQYNVLCTFAFRFSYCNRRVFLALARQKSGRKRGTISTFYEISYFFLKTFVPESVRYTGCLYLPSRNHHHAFRWTWKGTIAYWLFCLDEEQVPFLPCGGFVLGCLCQANLRKIIKARFHVLTL